MKRLWWLMVMAIPLSVACFEGKDDDDDDDDDDDTASDDTGVDGTDDTGETTEGTPDIEVDPMGIDFGTRDLGSSTDLQITIRNVGDGPLTLSQPTLASGEAFTVSTLLDTTVAPGGDEVFVLSFAPTALGAASDTLTIDSNDPDEPTVTFSVEGVATGGMPVLTPDELDFGAVAEGCDGTGTLTLSNGGDAPLTVESIEVADPFTADPGITLPAVFAAGASIDITVGYDPLGGSVTESLLVTTDFGDATATLAGTADSSATVTDTWTASSGETDILFAIDRSGSMYDDITDLVSSVPTLASELDALGYDWRLAFVVEDSGCINGSDLFIDSTFSAADVESTADTMIALGSAYGSNTERAFMLLDAATSASTTGGCNAGLLRSSATLNLVGFSDEPEQSVNPYGYYVALFQSLKADPADVVMHAIGGDYPSGCASASAYTGFYEATVSTGGTFHSICGDMGTNMTDLAAGIVVGDASTYVLSAAPVEDTLTMQVDGVSSSAWTFDATTNAVTFSSADVPAAGATVEASYVQDACP